MATIFDGDNLTITLDAPVSGVLSLDIARLYSEWKEWQLESFQNIGYPTAFRTVAGDPLVDTASITAYYFIQNNLGWRLRPFESDHTILISGNLIPENSTLPVSIPTIGAFTVLGFGLQPQTQTIAVGSGVTQQDKDDIENQIFARIVEGGFTFEQIIRLTGAMAAGDITQAVDGSYTITGLDGVTARILGDLAANNGRDITSVDAS